MSKRNKSELNVGDIVYQYILEDDGNLKKTIIKVERVMEDVKRYVFNNNTAISFDHLNKLCQRYLCSTSERMPEELKILFQAQIIEEIIQLQKDHNARLEELQNLRDNIK